MDIAPIQIGHVLVIPKKHVRGGSLFLVILKNMSVVEIFFSYSPKACPWRKSFLVIHKTHVRGDDLF